MNHYFVLCDQEKAYVESFTALLNERRLLPYQIQGITGREDLEEFCRTHRVDVLLMEEELCGEEPFPPVGKRFLLRSLPAPDEENVLFKYQPVSHIVEKILQAIREPAAENVPDVEIIGVYSPACHREKTQFALALGQILAKERPALYMNFQGFSGLHRLLGKTGQGDLSDLLYLAKQGKLRKEPWRERCVHTVNNLDYILPPVSPEDLQCVTAKELSQVISLLEESGYRTLILELHEFIPGFFALLRKCRVIYMPTGEDLLSKAGVSQYRQLLEDTGQEAVLQKTVPVKPPYHNGFGEAGEYVEQLVWGELGDYVRSLLWGK